MTREVREALRRAIDAAKKALGPAASAPAPLDAILDDGDDGEDADGAESEPGEGEA